MSYLKSIIVKCKSFICHKERCQSHIFEKEFLSVYICTMYNVHICEKNGTHLLLNNHLKENKLENQKLFFANKT